MPCTTIETCWIAWLRCGWILQAILWGLSSWDKAPLKPCQTISPGVHDSKKPPWTFSLCYRRCYTSKQRPQCQNHHLTPCLGDTGKTNLLRTHHTMKTFQSVMHWEAQTPLSMVKISLEKGHLARPLEWPTLTLQGDLQEWWFRCKWKHLVCRCDQWTVFHSTWDKFCLRGLAEGAKATHYPQYLMEKTS